jgi:NAD(P)-dependent dehydrogenase (short-subunit alcohol dehydrogenase family)
LESSLKSHAASLWSPDCMAGKVVLVTGAGRGIGRETARTFAALGASVMGVSRTEGELADLANEAAVEYLAESVDTVEGCTRIIEETRRASEGSTSSSTMPASVRSAIHPSGTCHLRFGRRRWRPTSTGPSN